MTASDREYSVYALSGLPVGLFGEAYVVCTGVELQNSQFRGEHFILTQRPSEALQIGTIDIPVDGVPPDLGPIDSQFARDEALRQAEMDFFSLLEARALQLGREDLAYLPIELRQTNYPLLGCWMRGRFVAQLRQIKDTTASQSLRTYLGLLEQVRVDRRPG